MSSLLADVGVRYPAAFSISEINIGIIPTFGGTQRLARNIGRKAAIELILTGRVFNAEEAARLGLVNRVVPGASLLPEALAFAEVLAAKLPLTVSAALAAIHRGLDASIDDGLAIETGTSLLWAFPTPCYPPVPVIYSRLRLEPTSHDPGLQGLPSS